MNLDDSFYNLNILYNNINLYIIQIIQNKNKLIDNLPIKRQKINLYQYSLCNSHDKLHKKEMILKIQKYIIDADNLLQNFISEQICYYLNNKFNLSKWNQILYYSNIQYILYLECDKLSKVISYLKILK